MTASSAVPPADQPPRPRIRFRLVHVFYGIALLAAALATFGAAGLVLATIVLAFWAYIYLGSPRPRSLVHWFLPVLAAFCLIDLVRALGFNNAREAALRVMCANHVKLIAMALNNYHAAQGSYPPAFVPDKDGKPMHSWRVLLLPYLSEKSRYGKYNFGERWDGPNNRQLLEPMPDIYRCPSDPRTGPGQGVCTSYVAVVGPGTAWPGTSARKIGEIQDGAANTILLLEDRTANIPWMAPRDLGQDQALDSLASDGPQAAGPHANESLFYQYSIGRNVAFADANFQFLYDGLSRDTLSNMLTIDGGVSPEPPILGIPVGGTKRLKVGNCYRFAVCVLLMLFPLPWVWRKQAS